MLNFYDFYFHTFFFMNVVILSIFFIRLNIIILFMLLELLIFFVNINMILITHVNDDIIGYIFSIFIIAVSGTELALGLSLLIIYYTDSANVMLGYFSKIKN